jgi:chromosome segregation ATPase
MKNILQSSNDLMRDKLSRLEENLEKCECDDEVHGPGSTKCRKKEPDTECRDNIIDLESLNEKMRVENNKISTRLVEKSEELDVLEEKNLNLQEELNNSKKLNIEYEKEIEYLRAENKNLRASAEILCVGVDGCESALKAVGSYSLAERRKLHEIVKPIMYG